MHACEIISDSFLDAMNAEQFTQVCENLQNAPDPSPTGSFFPFFLSKAVDADHVSSTVDVFAQVFADRLKCILIVDFSFIAQDWENRGLRFALASRIGVKKLRRTVAPGCHQVARIAASRCTMPVEQPCGWLVFGFMEVHLVGRLDESAKTTRFRSVCRSRSVQ